MDKYARQIQKACEEMLAPLKRDIEECKEKYGLSDADINECLNNEAYRISQINFFEN